MSIRPFCQTLLAQKCYTHRRRNQRGTGGTCHLVSRRRRGGGTNRHALLNLHKSWRRFSLVSSH